MLDLILPKQAASGSAPNVWKSSDPYPGWNQRNESGIGVNEEVTLTIAGAWCATRVISEALAEIPLHLYRRQGRQSDLDESHPLYDIVADYPNPETTSFSFRESLTAQMVLWGNGFAEIERDPQTKTPMALWPIHASRVARPLDSERAEGFAYSVNLNDGSRVLMRPDEVLHCSGVYPDAEGWGRGVITQARLTLGFAKATEVFGASFFGQGAHPSGVLKMPGFKDQEARRKYRAEWKEAHGLGTNNIAILPPEAEFVRLTMSNEDSQFLESRSFNVIELCRWFRVPPHFLYSMISATFNNIEVQGKEFVTYSMAAWFRRWCSQLKLKLLSESERKSHYFGFDTSDLLKGDMPTRAAFHQSSILNGWRTVNQVRAVEGEPGIGPAGDVHLIPANVVTLEGLVSGQQDLSIPSTTTVQPPNPTGSPAPNPAEQRAEAAADGADVVASGGESSHLSERPRRQTSRESVGRCEILGAARVSLVDVVARFFKRQASMIARHLSKSPNLFGAWLADFIERETPKVAEALGPALGVLRLGGIDHDAETIATQLMTSFQADALQARNTQTEHEVLVWLDACQTTRTESVVHQLMENAE